MGRVDTTLETEGYLEGPPSPKLTHAEVIALGSLRLTWSDGVTRDVDLSDRFENASSALGRMIMIPEVFRDFSIEEGGHGLVWINGLDFCADALRIIGDEQLAGQA